MSESSVREFVGVLPAALVYATVTSVLTLLATSPLSALAAQVPTVSGPDPAAVRAAVDSGYAAYIAANASADARALALVYDTGGVRLNSNGAMARGRDSIAASVGRFFQRVGPVRVRIEVVDLWVVGDVAYETGIWSYRYTPPGATERRIGGRYVTAWRRQPDGHWRILADLGVPGTALPEGW